MTKSVLELTELEIFAPMFSNSSSISLSLKPVKTIFFPANLSNFNPVDLNALLYRNAKLIYDLQIEVDGAGDDDLLNKSEHIKKLYNIFWDKKTNFYFDNNFAEKRLSRVRSLAGFMPMFVKMVNDETAGLMQKNVLDFLAPGGLTITDKSYTDDVSDTLELNFLDHYFLGFHHNDVLIYINLLHILYIFYYDIQNILFYN